MPKHLFSRPVGLGSLRSDQPTSNAANPGVDAVDIADQVQDTPTINPKHSFSRPVGLGSLRSDQPTSNAANPGVDAVDIADQVQDTPTINPKHSFSRPVGLGSLRSGSPDAAGAKSSSVTPDFGMRANFNEAALIGGGGQYAKAFNGRAGGSTGDDTAAPRRPGGRASAFEPLPWRDPNPPIMGENEPGRDEWIGPWRSRRPSLPESASSVPERHLSISSTILDNTIPAVYGSCRVTGMCGFAYAASSSDTTMVLGFIFAHGKQASIASLEVAEESVATGATAAATGVPWILQCYLHDGDSAGSPSSISMMNTASAGAGGMSAAEQTTWKRFAHAAIQIDLTSADLPPTFQATALLGGQSFADWGVNGAGVSTAAHTNPAAIAYHIFTDATVWKGDLSARLDTTSHTTTWDLLHAWCAETPGSETRWEFIGPIYQRDPDAAIAEVLGHAFADTYVDTAGVVRVWAEMPPEAITGTWTASGSTNPLGSGGAATTDLAVGDWVYIESAGTGGYTAAKVTAVNGDDDIEIDVTVSGTAAKIRKLSGVHIQQDDWLRLPNVQDRSTYELPDYMRVWWTDKADQSGQHYNEYQDAGGGTTTRTEITLSGCSNAIQADRYGETSSKLQWNQKWQWVKGIARPECGAGQLDVGDILVIDDGNDTRIMVRVHPPLGVRYRDGLVELPKLVYFDPQSFGEDTDATAVTPPSWTNWTTAAPPNVSSVAYTFNYYGATDRLSSKHNTVDTWSNKSNVTVTADQDAGPDGGGSDADHVSPTDVSGYVYDTTIIGRAGGQGAERPFVWMRSDPTPGEGVVNISRHSGGTERPVNVRAWWRWYPASDTGSDATIRVDFPTTGGPDVYLWGAGSFPLAEWQFMESVTWVQPSNITEINSVRLEYKTTATGPWTLHAAVPVEAQSISWGTAADAEFPPLPWGWYDWRLVVFSFNRRKTAFPDPGTINYGQAAAASRVAKTSDYTVTQNENGTVFTTAGASANVQFTLPDPFDGGHYVFCNKVDYNMVVATTDSDLDIVWTNDNSVRSIGFQTTGEKIGGVFEFWSDGTSWFCAAPCRNAVTTEEGQTQYRQQVCLSTYVDKVARFSEWNLHGGIDSLATAGAIDNAATPSTITVTAGIGKLVIVVNAGSDLVGDIIVTGTSVNRETGATTASDTDTVTINGTTTDSSSTDAQGNVIHGFSNAYITSKWFTGTVVLSTAATNTVTLTDVDIYQVAFEQFNDTPEVRLETLDVTALATNANAWVYGYIYSLVVTGDTCVINNEASISVASGAAAANKYYRLRRGNIDKDLNGASDGIWVDVYWGPTNQQYWEDANSKVWATIGVPVETR